MATRVEIPDFVRDERGQALAGASVTVQVRSTRATATVYAAETGATTLANPLTSAADGSIAGWVDPGQYLLVVTARGVTYLQPIDAAQGTGVPVSQVTSLPSSPVDGQEVYYVVDATNGLVWHMRYNAAGGTYKWEYLGGSPLTHEVATLETVTNAAYVDSATVWGVTVPNAGDYLFRGTLAMFLTGAGTAGKIYASLKIGAAATADVDALAVYGCHGLGAGDKGYEGGIAIVRNVSAASTLCKVQYKHGATVSLQYRDLHVVPIRIA